MDLCSLSNTTSTYSTDDTVTTKTTLCYLTAVSSPDTSRNPPNACLACSSHAG